MQVLFDIKNWNRRKTYEYFKTFDSPTFNICLNLDITELYNKCITRKYKFNHILQYCALKALNEIQEFRLRISDDNVVLFDKIDGGTVLMLDDHSIRFCFYEFSDSFSLFQENALLSEASVKESLDTDPRSDNLNIIHFSVIPWFAFTSVSHAQKGKENNSIPKIVFGQFSKSSDQWLIPLSIDANHALMDAWHVNQFIIKFQESVLSF